MSSSWKDLIGLLNYTCLFTVLWIAEFINYTCLFSVWWIVVFINL